ncbi:hypothetical protein G9X43_07765 [Cronobacter turicensis]|uniref:hypothetical protein n=1 Tax=Cronobacter turicensis TaxID=413502 RepID=UPI001411DB48|nr:hypothetical protein [Cronobacter turicensis]NHV08319.1 hypothetical protein [Cronobacter turicensis]NHV62795.1 hypothetical protein [Cronobacter turicensis]NHW09736.1 hypothetical protein [Cronobacter turicensis]
MKNLVIILGALALSACSNTPVPTNQANEVTGSKLLTTIYSSPTDNTGTLIVKRDTGKMGSLCTVHVFIDGTPLANLESEEKVTFHVSPGSHILSANPKGACPGGLSELTTDVTANKTQVFRASFASAGDFSLSPTAF